MSKDVGVMGGALGTACLRFPWQCVSGFIVFHVKLFFKNAFFEVGML